MAYFRERSTSSNGEGKRSSGELAKSLFYERECVFGKARFSVLMPKPSFADFLFRKAHAVNT